MNVVEALAIVESIDIHWPNAKLPDETKKAWARQIVAEEPTAIAADGLEAIRDLSSHQHWPPAVADIILGIHGARLSRPVPALPEPEGEFPSFAEHLRANPDQAEIIRGLKQDRQHEDSCIPAGIEQLFLLSGVKPEDKVARVRRRVQENL